MNTRLCFVLPLMTVCVTPISADVVLLGRPALPVAVDAEAKRHDFLMAAGANDIPTGTQPRSTSPPLVVITGFVVGILFLIRSRVGPIDERGTFNLRIEERSGVGQRFAYVKGRRDRVPGALASPPV